MRWTALILVAGLLASCSKPGVTEVAKADADNFAAFSLLRKCGDTTFYDVPGKGPSTWVKPAEADGYWLALAAGVTVDQFCGATP
jgi:hypothetical protein